MVVVTVFSEEAYYGWVIWLIYIQTRHMSENDVCIGVFSFCKYVLNGEDEVTCLCVNIVWCKFKGKVYAVFEEKGDFYILMGYLFFQNKWTEDPSWAWAGTCVLNFLFPCEF